MYGALVLKCSGSIVTAGGAAPTIVQIAQSSFSNTYSVTATFASNPTSGNLLVAACAYDPSEAPVALPAGWTSALLEDSGSRTLQLWTKVSNGTEKSVTATAQDGSYYESLILVEVAGANASPINASAHSYNSASTTTYALVSATSTVANCLALAFVAFNGSAGPGVWSASDGFTALAVPANATWNTCLLCYDTIATAGAVSTTITATNSSQNIASAMLMIAPA